MKCAKVVQVPLAAAGAISKQLVERSNDSLKRRTSKEADFQGEDTWDEEDNGLLEEELAFEEVQNTAIIAYNMNSRTSLTLLR